MRPDIPQKSGTVLSNNEDRSPLVDSRESVTSEVSRPSCNAAAIFGIAISVGAGSLIAPGFQRIAQANEPVPMQVSVEASRVTENNAVEPVAQPQAVAAPQAIASSLETQFVAVHAVQQGETLWQIAQEYQVGIRALANANHLSTSSVLKVGQVLRLPGTAGANSASEAPVNLEEISQSVPEIPVLASSQSSELNSDVQTRQAATVTTARVQSDRLEHSLAELGEESNTVSETVEAGQSKSVVPTIAQATHELPVTQLANVPLPAIGGAEPDADMPPETQLNVDKRETDSATIATSETPLKLDKVDPFTAGTGTREAALKEGAPTPTVAATAPTSLVPSSAQPSSAKPKFDPTPLLAEISELRDRYQDRRSSVVPVLTKANQPVAVIAQAEPPQSTKQASVPVQAAAVTAEPTQGTAVATNPDFVGRKPNSALSIELRNLVQSKPQLQKTGKVVQPVPQVKPQVVARATLGSEAYAPVTPAVKRMVAPNLPAIGNEDAYLPGGLASRGYLWPAKGVLTSGFGPRWGRMHRGIDIAAPTGTPIIASAAGKVIYARWNDGGFGYLVELEHADGTMTRYAHNSRILVREGQTVAQGQQVSEMGSTGFSTGPHLHFEVHPHGRGAVNPIAMLDRQG